VFFAACRIGPWPFWGPLEFSALACLVSILVLCSGIFRVQLFYGLLPFPACILINFLLGCSILRAHIFPGYFGSWPFNKQQIAQLHII
jgi:hypothetical protein